MMDNRRTSSTVFTTFKRFSWVVLALMAIAMLYAGVLSIANWTEISV